MFRTSEGLGCEEDLAKLYNHLAIPFVKFVYRRTHDWSSLALAVTGFGSTFVGPWTRRALTIAPAARIAAPTAKATVNPCTIPSSVRLVP
jgi:hypothetical protein